MSSVSVVQYSAVLQQSNSNERREVIVLRNKDEEDAKIKRKKAGKSSPQPVAVARRNARERNRVKQVNNGFANLRQHIPNFIASAFESGRGSNKKLSKVETLRMAVEYIRSLEEILSMEVDSSAQGSFVLTDDDSDNAQEPQFIKLSSSYFQNYDDSENVDPNHLDQVLMDPSLDSYLNSMQTVASLSPEMYSDQSLSPNSMRDQGCFGVQVKVEVPEELPVISLKAEAEMADEHMDVIQWWEQQQQPQQHS